MNVFQPDHANTTLLHQVPNLFTARHADLNGANISIPDWVTGRSFVKIDNSILHWETDKHTVVHVCLHVRRPAECPKRKTISNLKMAISIRRLMHSPRGTQNFTAHQSPFSIGRLLKLFSCSMTRHPETRRLLNFLQTTKNKTQKIWKKRMHWKGQTKKKTWLERTTSVWTAWQTEEKKQSHFFFSNSVHTCRCRRLQLNIACCVTTWIDVLHRCQ